MHEDSRELVVSHCTYTTVDSSSSSVRSLLLLNSLRLPMHIDTTWHKLDDDHGMGAWRSGGLKRTL